jgi:hypothetical protein
MESDEELRAELKAAIAKVTHQIDIQSGSGHFAASGPSSRESLIQELQSELANLEDALAGLGSGEPPAEPQSVSQPDSEPEPPETYRRGVLIALKGRSFDTVVLSRFLLILGSLGVAGAAAVALAHFAFGAPLYDRSHRLLSDPEALQLLAAFAGAFGFALALGFFVRRDANSSDGTDDLVS